MLASDPGHMSGQCPDGHLRLHIDIPDRPAMFLDYIIMNAPREPVPTHTAEAEISLTFARFSKSHSQGELRPDMVMPCHGGSKGDPVRALHPRVRANVSDRRGGLAGRDWNQD